MYKITIAKAKSFMYTRGNISKERKMKEEAKEFFNKKQDDFRIEIPESLLATTLKCLRNLRSYYNLYNDDDQEIIDAIHVLEEELHWNVLGIEGE